MVSESSSSHIDLDKLKLELEDVRTKASLESTSLLERFRAFVAKTLSSIRRSVLLQPMDHDLNKTDEEHLFDFYAFYCKKTQELYDDLIQALGDYPQVKKDLQPFYQHWREENKRLFQRRGGAEEATDEQFKRCQEATELLRAAMKTVENHLETLL